LFDNARCIARMLQTFDSRKLFSKAEQLADEFLLHFSILDKMGLRGVLR